MNSSPRVGPKLAVFPKGFMDELCVTGEMRLAEWVELAASLDVDGLEYYSGFLDLKDPADWPAAKKMAEQAGLEIPMLCCSPDFTHPDSDFRQDQIERQRHWIDMTVALGGQYCRVLSGQRRPELDRQTGVDLAARCIGQCLSYAAARDVVLILENHYKDNYWEHPEFAQHMDVFCDLVRRVKSGPHAEYFGVNYDPSNTFLAGEDPLELLQQVKQFVRTMHASDRYLKEGTLEDLRKEEDAVGYARRLSHGVIGQGLNDYDAIFTTLRDVGFAGWISIEDGENGMDDLRESVNFLRKKMNEYWPNETTAA